MNILDAINENPTAFCVLFAVLLISVATLIDWTGPNIDDEDEY